MALGSLEARLSALEQIIIIIIIGGGFPGVPPKGDSFATDQTRIEALARGLHGFRPPWGPGTDPAVTDTTRLEALYRILGHGPIGDPFSPDLARLSAVELESGVHRVNAELVRLRALESQMQDRLREIKAQSGE